MVVHQQNTLPHREVFPYPPPGDTLNSYVGLSPRNFHQYLSSMQKRKIKKCIALCICIKITLVTGSLIRVPRLMSLVKLLANPEHQKSSRFLVRNIGYCVVFCPFHFAIVFRVLHLFAASDYPIGISKTRSG